MSPSNDSHTTPHSGKERSRELRGFLFLTVVLVPALSVAVVGGFGFAIWIFQMFMGPPGPPSG